MSSLTVVLGVVAVGCGGGEGGANDNGVTGAGQASQTEQQLCAALDDVSVGLKQLQNLDPKTASAAEIKTDAANLRKATKGAISAASAQSKVDVESLDADVANLEAAVKRVPPGTTPEKELQEVEPQLNKTAELVQSTVNGLECSTTS